MSPGHHDIAVEVVRLRLPWLQALQAFHAVLQTSGDTRLFSPHPFATDVLQALCAPEKQDLHYLLVVGSNVVGYGMLRGWDEGYSTPSLGIAIHPGWRGIGLSELLMHFLHGAARARGTMRLRLRVHPSNAKAIGLYRKLGYQFEAAVDADGLCVAYRSLQA